jgi:predicted MFS family arabinose efflux permease
MRGTGRYNVDLGAVATVHGVGASLSNTVAGMIVVHAGYSTAFLTLAAVAAAAFATLLFAMPETGKPRNAKPGAGTPRIKLPGVRPAAVVEAYQPW